MRRLCGGGMDERCALLERFHIGYTILGSNKRLLGELAKCLTWIKVRAASASARHGTTTQRASEKQMLDIASMLLKRK